MFMQLLFWAGNQGNHQDINSTLCLLLKNLFINQSYYLTQGSIPVIFEKILRIGGIEKLILAFIFYLLHPHENQSKYLV
jgi:hypothetical protein